MGSTTFNIIIHNPDIRASTMLNNVFHRLEGGGGGGGDTSIHNNMQNIRKIECVS